MWWDFVVSMWLHPQIGAYVDGLTANSVTTSMGGIMGVAKNKIEDVTEEHKQQLKELSVSGNSNAAMCWLKQNEFAKALKCCNKALALDAHNPKLLYRRGCAHNGVGDPDSALKDLEGTWT